jgi:hypothetical protein
VATAVPSRTTAVVADAAAAEVAVGVVVTEVVAPGVATEADAALDGATVVPADGAVASVAPTVGSAVCERGSVVAPSEAGDARAAATARAGNGLPVTADTAAAPASSIAVSVSVSAVVSASEDDGSVVVTAAVDPVVTAVEVAAVTAAATGSAAERAAGFDGAAVVARAAGVADVTVARFVGSVGVAAVGAVVGRTDTGAATGGLIREAKRPAAGWGPMPEKSVPPPSVPVVRVVRGVAMGSTLGKLFLLKRGTRLLRR